MMGECISKHAFGKKNIVSVDSKQNLPFLRAFAAKKMKKRCVLAPPKALRELKAPMHHKFHGRVRPDKQITHSCIGCAFIFLLRDFKRCAGDAHGSCRGHAVALTRRGRSAVSFALDRL